MNTFRNLVFVSLAALMAACSTTRSAPDVSVRPLTSLNPELVTVSAVEWRTRELPALSVTERDLLGSGLRTQLEDAVRRLPKSSANRRVVIRATITQVDVVSPVVNTVSALALFLPFDSGGAQVELEAIDDSTGVQLAALHFSRVTPMTELKARFHRLAPAQLALAEAATEFASLLGTSATNTYSSITSP